MATQTFPTEKDIETCLSSGEGLPEGKIELLLAKIQKSFLNAGKQSYRIENFKNMIQSNTKHSAQ